MEDEESFLRLQGKKMFRSDDGKPFRRPPVLISDKLFWSILFYKNLPFFLFPICAKRAMSLKVRPQTPTDEKLCDPNLPPRIFIRDYYPTGARINAYSKLELLAEITVALKGTPELERIHKSQFEKIFKIPARKTSFSGKIVHKLLCRQLWTSKPHEVWFVFGGQPIRFSLRVFGIVTGLKCGRFPDEKTVKERGRQSTGLG